MRLRRCAQNYLGAKKYCANPNTAPDSQSSYSVRKGLGTQSPQSIREYNLATAIATRLLTKYFMCEMGFSIFRVHESTQSGEYNLGLFTHYLIKREDERRKMIPLVMEVLPVLVFITFPHLGKIVSIPSVLYVSASAYTNLRSIMSSVWISHRPQINMSPRVYRMLLPWITSPSDILRPWWIRSPLCMYVG